VSTIGNKTITQTVTLGSVNSYPTYASPLTIASTGTIRPGSSNANAVYGPNTQAWTVANYGEIAATGDASGIDLSAGGSVGNAGMVEGSIGVYIQTPGSVTNSGTIIGMGGQRGGFGVFLGASGSVGNTGLIKGGYGVLFFHGAGTVTNSGTIEGTKPFIFEGMIGGGGVDLFGVGGSVGNTGLIQGFYGFLGVGIDNYAGTVTNSGTILGSVSLGAGGTVTNSGTIIGRYGTAVGFGGGRYGTAGGGGSNLLVLEHGYYLNGVVAGGIYATNTVELGGSLGAALTVDYTGLGLRNFQDVRFGSGGYDTLKVTRTAGTLPVTISGFGTSDIIDLTQIGTDGTIANNNTIGHTVTVSGSHGSVVLQLDASDGTGFATMSDGASGTDLLIPCFCRSTRILTERGEVPVEDLAVGDRVTTVSGIMRPIVWIGVGRDLVTCRNSLARPIIVRRGALADDVPRRDLYLTHGHALYVDGVLIPVENLVNHRSILWDRAARVVEYYHIELADHDVLFAEGAPAETYHDDGNRAQFHNTRPGSAAAAARPTFAPLLSSGDVVDRVWAALYQRAGGEIAGDTTDDPDLHLVIDGVRLDPTATYDSVFTFALEGPPARTLCLSSRSGVPSLLGLSSDHRPLGVAIKQVILDHAGIPTVFEHDARQLREGGCHLPEDGFSWTDGEFELPPRFFAQLNGAFTLIVHTERRGIRYPNVASAVAA